MDILAMQIRPIAFLHTEKQQNLNLTHQHVNLTHCILNAAPRPQTPCKPDEHGYSPKAHEHSTTLTGVSPGWLGEVPSGRCHCQSGKRVNVRVLKRAASNSRRFNSIYMRNKQNAVKVLLDPSKT